ncbi:MAG: GTP cyclohydrolase I [Microbacteriaceae bacterium]
MTHSRPAPSHLRAVPESVTPERKVDLQRAEHAVSELLEALGYDSGSEAFAATPGRVALSLAELTGGRPEPMSVFVNDDHMQGPVSVRDIAFVSLCEHHLLPFQGSVHISYIPGERIGGFSAFAQVVESFAHNLGLQETLTVRVADYLMQQLEPQALSVTIEAQHMCMAARGVRAREARIVTRELRGETAQDPAFLSFCATTGMLGATDGGSSRG